MLDFMRNKASSWVIKGVLIVVALSFILWGGFSRSDLEDTSIVAKVNGNIISDREYQSTYNNLYESYRKIYKKNLPGNIIDQIKKTTIDQLIQLRLISKEIEGEKFSVSEDDVIQKIVENNKELTVNGELDWDKYTKIPPVRRHEYEADIKRSLLFKKMESVIKDGVKLSPNEIKEAYDLENEQVKVEYIQIKPSSLIEQVEVTDDILNKYYKKNAAPYKVSEKIKVEYAIGKAADFEKDVSISEEDIKGYYNEHGDEYFIEAKVKASHILIKPSKENKEKEDSDKKAKEKANKVLKEIKEGGNFEELAKKYSEDSTASKGGDLGFFSHGSMVKEFEKAAFSLKKGETSGVVKTNFGYHIIKVTDLQSARKKSFEEVSTDIENKLKQKGSIRLARQQIKKLLRTLKKGENKNFKKEAESLSLKYNVTDFFGKGENIPGFSNSSKFVSEALSLNSGDISNVIKEGKNYYIINLSEKKEAYTPDLKEVKKKVEEKFKKEESNKLAEVKLKDLLKKFNEGSDFSTLAKEINEKVETPAFFKRNDSIPSVGRNKDFINTSFELESGKADTLISNQRYYLIKLIEKKGVDEKKFFEEKDSFSKRILIQKQNRVYSVWLASLKDKADIWINKRYQ